MGAASRSYGISQTPQVWLDHQVSEQRGRPGLQLGRGRGAVPGRPAGRHVRGLRAAARAAGARPRRPGAAPGPAPGRAARAARRRQRHGGAGAGGLLHEPFLARGGAPPEAPAVITRRGAHLRRARPRLAALAHRLRRLGAAPEPAGGRGDGEGLGAGRGGARCAARRARAYLPIDARPAGRAARATCWSAARSTVALTQPRLRRRLDWPSGVERSWSVDGDDFAGAAPDAAGAIQGPEDLAYVIFTSGSTGTAQGGDDRPPRRAQHGASTSTSASAAGPDDRVLALSSLSFDLSVYDIFGLLAAGGALVMPDAGAAARPGHWAELGARAAGDALELGARR